MADVLLGRTDGIEGFERHVVLKRIRAEHAQRPALHLDVPRRGARSPRSLHHQNIVQVYDIGEEDGEYFFAMEYIHGEDLRAVLSAVVEDAGAHAARHVVAIVVGGRGGPAPRARAARHRQASRSTSSTATCRRRTS